MNEGISMVLSYLEKLDYTDTELKKLTRKYFQNYESYSVRAVLTSKYSYRYALFPLLDILKSCNKSSFYWSNLYTLLIDNKASQKSLINFTLYLSTTDYLDKSLSIGYQKMSLTFQYVIKHSNILQTTDIQKMRYLHSLHINEYYVNNVKHSALFVININNPTILSLLCEFINANTSVLKNNRLFFEVFEDSVSDKNKLLAINSFTDFTYEIFKEQFWFFDKLALSNILCSFYLFIWGMNPDYDLFPLSSGINYLSMKRKEFYKEYRSGYRMVMYNPFDPIPLFDKWIINYNGYGNNNLLANRANGISIDFQKVEDENYRLLVKTWLWKDSSLSIHAKISYHRYIFYFFNFLSKNRIQDKFNITIEEVLMYKNHIFNTVKSDTNISKYLYNINGILRFLKENSLLNFDDNIFYHLRYSSKSPNKSKIIPNDELMLLANLMKSNAENSDLNKLYYLIFYIALETEFRISQILSLNVDCVGETVKKNQYVISSKTKTSNGEEIPQSITIYVKKHIDDIIRITQELRNECQENDLNKRLFLKRNYSKKIIISPITPENFNNYLTACCKVLGIPNYNSSNLRDTHITKAEEFIIRNGLSDIEQSILTGHKDIETDNRHYVSHDITEMLELMHGTTIGNIDINGQVLKNSDTSIANSENEVEAGCGYCSSTTCSVTSYLGCLLCNFFIATVDRIPFFEEQIKVIDKKLLNATLPHDKEDYFNIKQLLLNYLRALYIKREEQD